MNHPLAIADAHQRVIVIYDDNHEGVQDVDRQSWFVSGGTRMTRYDVEWLDTAFEQYDGHLPHTRSQIDACLEKLRTIPVSPDSAGAGDPWTTVTYGRGAGMIAYTVRTDRVSIVVVSVT